MKHYTPREEVLWASIKNMPSEHISLVFDHYLRLMLEPIAQYTNVIYEGIAEALVLLTNQRRKITNEDRAIAISKLFAAMSGDRDNITATLMALGIERNILLDMVHGAMVNDEVFLPGVEPEPLRRHLFVLLSDLELFRDIVLDRYIPLITKQSSGFAWGRRQNGLVVEVADAKQNYFLAALRALDKFDSDSGTLTTYMANWLRNASHSIFNVHLGVAYEVTRGVRNKMFKGEVDSNNHAVPIEGNPSAESAPDTLPDDEHDLELAALLNDAVLWLRYTGRLGDYRLALLAVKANYPLSLEDVRQQAATLENNSDHHS